jgi:hypothetical protein
LEAEGPLLGDPDEGVSEEEFEQEIEATGRGDWDTLGIDPPPDLEPATIDELRASN